MSTPALTTSVTTNGRGGAVIALAETGNDGIARLLSYQVLPLERVPELIEQLQKIITADGQRAGNPRWSN